MARDLMGIKKPHPLGSVATRSGVSPLTVVSATSVATSDGVKISELPAADAANDSDQLEVNQAGTSRRVTVDQLGERIATSDWIQDAVDVAATGDSGIWYLKAHDAVGDGVTDDTAAVQAVITAAAGKIIDGAGLTYKITATLTGVASNTMLRNMTLDFSTMPDPVGSIDYGLRIDGLEGTAVNLTANTLVNAAVVTVGSTASFSAEQLCFLTSNKVWDSTTSTTYGQYGRVKSIDSGTQLTLYDTVVLNFNTADTARIAPVTPVQSVSIHRVKFVGSSVDGRGQIALHAALTEALSVTECEVRNFDYTAIDLSRSYKPVVDRCRMRHAVNTSTAYGVAVWSGCYAATISNCVGEDLRHTVTLGNNAGINLYTLIIGNAALASKDAGFDSHSAAMYTTYANNRVEMAAVQFGASSHDGIISEGGHTTFIGNTVVGPKGVGLYYQPLMQDGTRGSLVAIGNTVVLDDIGYASAIASIGIYVLVGTNGANVSRVTITGNSVTGGLNNPNLSIGIYTQCGKAGGSISNVSVVGNQVSGISSHGILLRGQGTGTVDSAEVSGNGVDTTGFYGIYFLADEAGAIINNITGGFNVLKSSTFGLRLQATSGTITTGRFGKNIYKSPLTTATSVSATGNVVNAIFDDADSASNADSATAATTLVRGTNWYTFSRGTAQTVTLPLAASNVGYEINLLNSAAQTVDSTVANVVPRAGGGAVTAILPATAGAWAVLRSDGTTWRIVKGS